MKLSSGTAPRARARRPGVARSTAAPTLSAEPPAVIQLLIEADSATRVRELTALQSTSGNRAVRALIGSTGPAPASGSTATAPAVLRPAVRRFTAVQRKVLTSADLRRRGSAATTRFMRDVYDRQVAIWTGRGASYTASVPSRQLRPLAASDCLPGRSISVHRSVAGTIASLLAAARSELRIARAAGTANARGVTDVRVRSGYRSAQDQFGIWQREFPNYYRDTATDRAALGGGAHGAEAAQFLAEYINSRVFSPGYSPHQGAKTVDFTYQQSGVWAEADTDATAVAAWRASWLCRWLATNAASYGFAANPALNEPWHWEHA